MDTVDLTPNQFADLSDQQLMNKLENFREWSNFNEKATDMLEEVQTRYLKAVQRWVPQLNTVFPDRREHPKVQVVFTEFRAAETYLLDVYCKVTKEDGGEASYYAQTFGTDFKPLSEHLTPVTREMLVDLMKDRIDRI